MRLLNEKLGDGLHPKAGEFAAMKMCRHGDRGGIRYLLDLISEALLQESVKQYLDCVVLSRIYDVVPGLAMESPAGIMMRWRQVIHQHARQVLAG